MGNCVRVLNAKNDTNRYPSRRKRIICSAHFHTQKIAEQAKRIRYLQAAVFALVGDKEDIIESDPEDVSVRLEELSIARDDPDSSQVNPEDDLEYGNSDDEQASESVELQDPLWDSADNVYRCDECTYELESDVCFRCGKAFSIDFVRLFLFA